MTTPSSCCGLRAIVFQVIAVNQPIVFGSIKKRLVSIGVAKSHEVIIEVELMRQLEFIEEIEEGRFQLTSKGKEEFNTISTVLYQQEKEIKA